MKGRTERTVARLIEQVRRGGDAALRRLTRRFDGARRLSIEVSAAGVTYYVTYEKRSSGGGESTGMLKFSPTSLATATADGETPEVVYCNAVEAGVSFSSGTCKCNMTGNGKVTLANLVTIFGWILLALLPYGVLRRQAVRIKK